MSTVRDNQELTSQVGACHDNNSLFSSNERFLGYLTFFLSCSFHTPKQQYDHSAKLWDILTITIWGGTSAISDAIFW